MLLRLQQFHNILRQETWKEKLGRQDREDKESSLWFSINQLRQSYQALYFYFQGSLNHRNMHKESSLISSLAVYIYDVLGNKWKALSSSKHRFTLNKATAIFHGMKSTLVLRFSKNDDNANCG